jgi:hypothetical protein
MFADGLIPIIILLIIVLLVLVAILLFIVIPCLEFYSLATTGRRIYRGAGGDRSWSQLL